MSGSVYHPAKFKRTPGDAPASILEESSTQGSAQGLADTPEAQLREVNAKLMARVAELRQRNQELRNFEEIAWEKDIEIGKLRSAESELRTQLTVARAAADRDKGRDASHYDEVLRLRMIIERHQNSTQAEKEEYLRKLARISDQSWEKDLEIRRLTELSHKMKDELYSLQSAQSKRERQIETNNSNVSHLIQSLNETKIELERLRAAGAATQSHFGDKLAAACAERDQEIVRLQAVEENLKEEILQSEKAQAQLEHEISLHNNITYELQGSIDRLKQELMTLKAGHSAEMKRLYDEHLGNVVRIREESTRDLASVNERHRSEIQSLHSDYDRKIASLSTQQTTDIAVLREVERRLNEDIARSRQENVAQTQQIKALQETIQELKMALAAEQGALKSAREDVLAKEIEIKKKAAEVDALKAAETALNESLNSEKEARRRTESQSDEVMNRNSYLAREAADLRDRLARQEEANREVTKSVESFRRKAELAEAAADRYLKGEAKAQAELCEERFKRQQEQAHWQQAAQAADEKVTRLDQTLANQRAEAKSLREEHAGRVAELVKMNQELNAHLYDQREDAAVAQGDLKASQTENATLKKQVEQVTEKLAKLQAQTGSYSSEIATLQAMLKSKTDLINDLEAELMTERRESQKAAEKAAEELRARVESAKTEQAMLRAALGARTAGHESEVRDLEKRAQLMAVRENQLRIYANSITQQKSELVKHSRLLADEIQMALKVHPLKDYLQLTEFEIAKVEVQLKTTPTMSPDRARLESVIGQMIEQREFLKSVIASSQKRLDQQAANVLAIVRNPRLSAIPPLPPKIKTPGEGPAQTIAPPPAPSSYT